jgi:hypothetical protein
VAENEAMALQPLWGEFFQTPHPVVSLTLNHRLFAGNPPGCGGFEFRFSLVGCAIFAGAGCNHPAPFCFILKTNRSRHYLH